MQFNQVTTSEQVATLDAARDAVQFAALTVGESKSLTDPAKAAILRELEAMHQRLGRFSQLSSDADSLSARMANSGLGV